MLRSVLGVFVGLVTAVFVVGVIELAGHAIFPPPPGIDLHNPEQLKTIIDSLPIGAIVAVLVAWGAGALAGAFVAALIAGRAHLVHALVIGVIQMSFGIYTMLIIPHPLWFVIASLLIVPAAAWLGASLARRINPPKTTSLRSHDMRDGSMAC